MIDAGGYAAHEAATMAGGATRDAARGSAAEAALVCAIASASAASRVGAVRRAGAFSGTHVPWPEQLVAPPSHNTEQSLEA